MSQFEVQTNHTPAFVREFCTQKFMLFTSVLDEIIMGGLQLSPEAAKALKERGHKISGDDIAVASTADRLRAIEMYGKFGPGIRTDHRSEDGPARPSVILMPPWDDEEEAEAEDTPRKALPRGNGRKNGESAD